MLTETFIAEWTALALEMSAITGLPMIQHLDEAYDLVDPLLNFAAVWDLCARSQQPDIPEWLVVAAIDEIPL